MDDHSPPNPRGSTRLRISVRTLIALVGCCAAVLWAARVAWQSVPVNGWTRELRSGDVLRRRIAARELGQVGPEAVPDVVPVLVAALGDEDAEVRAAVVQALGSAAHAAPQTSAARDAAEAIARALNDPQVGVRAEAVGSLGVVGSRVPVDPPPALVAVLRRDESEEVRAMAATSLGQFRQGLEPAIPALFTAMADDVDRVRAACDAALTRRDLEPPRDVVPFLVQTLQEGRDPRFRYRAATVLGAAGARAEEAIPALIAALNAPLGPPPSVPAPRQPSLASESIAGNERRGPVVERPSAWDPACEAARALARVAPGSGRVGEVVAALTAALRSEHAWRRGAAAEGLFLIGEGAAPAAPALAAALTEALDAGEDTGNRSWMPRALAVTAPGTGAAGAAMDALTRALGAREEGTRAWSAEALGRFGPAARAAAPRLRELQNDPNLQVAREARAALEKIGFAAVPREPR
jgi:HEAT repeat protein